MAASSIENEDEQRQERLTDEFYNRLETGKIDLKVEHCKRIEAVLLNTDAIARQVFGQRVKTKQAKQIIRCCRMLDLLLRSDRHATARQRKVAADVMLALHPPKLGLRTANANYAAIGEQKRLRSVICCIGLRPSTLTPAER
jgi:hypothetical protein